MLCATCMSLFQKSATAGFHHHEYERLDAAARNGCKICHYLLGHRSLENWKPLKYEFFFDDHWERHWKLQFYDGDADIKDRPVWERPQELWIFARVTASSNIPPGYDEFLSLVNTDLESSPSRVRKDFPPPRDIPDDTGHEKVAQVAKNWLEACKRNHDCHHASGPQEAGWYPKRLIQVGNENQPPRLVISTSDTLEGTYAALSHCWGESPDFLMLTSDTLAEFRHEISFQRLPASFRDAIMTCRRMEIPYIWIDSLCILQAGPGARQDWLLHSETMHQVYQNCELNIAIDASSDPHGGAFRSRDPTYLQPCYIWTPFHDLPEPPPLSPNTISSPNQDTNADEVIHCKSAGGSSYLQDDTDGQPVPQNLCVIYTRNDFSWSRLHLPLNQRAWVFQERLLSPRTLHFSSDRITWECGKNTEINEYLADGTSDSLARGFDCLYQDTYTIRENDQLEMYYLDLVFPYTDRQLSYPDEDKLVAFAAVARRCSSCLGQDYFAGIFRSAMPVALLWEADLHRATKRSTTYRAPSWSWASLDGRILYGPLGEKGIVLASVQKATVDLIDPQNPFGQVKSASLTLTGPLVASKALISHHHNTEEANSQRNHTVMGQWFQIVPDTELLRSRDCESLWIDSQDDLYFLAILDDAHHTGGQCCLGLLIQKGTDGKFTRVGLWKGNPGFVSKHAKTPCEFKSETVTML
ncbi:hypothetical protein FSARC_9969 [Fusarium sarcochroum]|uniref:Heterokaryon incompatibility domain-containing protein n=1 Tax=Fusarium sarcochroum TaxID=1208366 RepID=A0A8H4TQ06_9HYPO|nr:hypothetical protein FSARC_9969 [Fusarium sarcochroum]